MGEKAMSGRLGTLKVYTTLIDAIRTEGMDEANPDVRKAVKWMEDRLPRLRAMHERMKRRQACPVCRRNCSMVVCYWCFQKLPQELRGRVRAARGAGELQQAVTAEVVTWLASERRTP
jgi:hypothetical protein